MVAHETAIFMRCNHWLYLLARRQSYYAIPVSIMAGSTADRIDALRGLAVSVIARISAVWLMWFINLMLFISFLPYERKIKCIFLTTLLICLFQKTFLKNCCSGRNSSTKLEDCRIRTLSAHPVEAPHGFPVG
jgi:hypothetical protein